MCYVIENFKLNFSYLRYYPCLRIIFFYRNIYKNYTLNSLFFNNLIFNNWSQIPLNFFTIFFIKGFTLVTTSQLQMKSTPIKLNFSNSLQFWALTKSLRLYNQYKHFTTYTTRLNLKSIVFDYRYYLVKNLLYLKIKKAPFKIVMLTFLKWVITPWIYFNNYLKLMSTPLNFTPQLLFLKYANTYFFKVYKF